MPSMPRGSRHHCHWRQTTNTFARIVVDVNLLLELVVSVGVLFVVLLVTVVALASVYGVMVVALVGV